VELAVPSTTRVLTSRSASSSLTASQMSLEAAYCSATSCCSLIQFPIVLDPRGSLFMVKVGQCGHCVHNDKQMCHEHIELHGTPAEAAQAGVRVVSTLQN